MKVPAIAKKSFDLLKNDPEYVRIVHDTISRLKKISQAFKRARQVHKIVDEYVEEVFQDKIVRELSPCKQGCTNCCYTEVSITEDEAELLVRKINGGVIIDHERLKKQAEVGDNQFFARLSYEERKCIFLDNNGSCSVYEDRPSVCRTNAVLGDSNQCDTRMELKSMRLVNTKKADMAIYASFYLAEKSGTLPEMIYEIMQSKQKVEDPSY